MARLIKLNSINTIKPQDVLDGSVCIIRNHPKSEDIGRIVQRYGNTFITIGKGCGAAYSSWLSGTTSVELEILPAGSIIEI